MTLALAAMFALGASAFADQQPNQQSIKKANMSGMKKGQQTATTTTSTDNRSLPLRAADNSMTFLKKTGQSIVHTPQIVSETFTGKRDLVSKHGIMTQREMKKTGGKKPSAPSKSVANRRG